MTVPSVSNSMVLALKAGWGVRDFQVPIKVSLCCVEEVLAHDLGFRRPPRISDRTGRCESAGGQSMYTGLSMDIGGLPACGWLTKLRVAVWPPMRSRPWISIDLPAETSRSIA